MRKPRLKISLYGRDTALESAWISELTTLMKSLGKDHALQVVPAREEITSLILVDAERAGWQDWARNFDRTGKSIVLVVDEGIFLPEAADLDLVDDLLVSPFRVAEVLSVIRHYHLKRESEEVLHESELALDEIQETNQIVERILASKTPKRFTGLKGIQVMSKHISGLKPGGDYFDLFESEKKDFVHILMVDSSNYGISAALLGMILSSSAKIASSAHQSCTQWVNAIYEELKVTLGESGHFSIFFGRLNRRDFSLHYQLHGSIESFVVDRNGLGKKLEKQGPAIIQKARLGEQSENVVQLNPKDRLVLLSDGFVQGVGGEAHLSKLFSEKFEQDPFHLVNELTFRIKSKLSPGETFPGEDCTAIVLDVENRVLRLAPTG